MAQTAQLHNLRVVDKEVDVDPELADVPVVHFGVGRLEHDLLRGQLLHDRAHHVGSPRLHVLRDPLGFDHQALDARVEELLAHVDQLAWVRGTDGFQVARRGVASGTELDAQLGLRLEPVRVYLIDEPQPVIARDREEAGRYLDDVEAVVVQSV